MTICYISAWQFNLKKKHTILSVQFSSLLLANRQIMPNNGSYGHWRAWFRDRNFACRLIIKAYAYLLKSTNLLPGNIWASAIHLCVKQIGSGYDTEFLAVQFRIPAKCLCLDTIFRSGVRQRAGFIITCRKYSLKYQFSWLITVF